LLWGDTHLHTSYSVDAYIAGNRTADPDVAYRYAKGEPVAQWFPKTLNWGQLCLQKEA